MLKGAFIKDHFIVNEEKTLEALLDELMKTPVAMTKIDW